MPATLERKRPRIGLRMPKRPLLWAFIAGVLLLAFGIMIYWPAGTSAKTEPGPQTQPTPGEYADPHGGEVEVFLQNGSTMWVPLYDELGLNEYRAAGTFGSDGSFVTYASDAIRAERGIDISEHQHEIDWAAVKAEGVDFAMIRAGWRGYTEGSLNEDLFFRQNVEGALANGIGVGIYFFSQAINVTEALQEADYLLELIKGYDITYPVAFDWEHIGINPARTDDVSAETLTQCAKSFAWRIASAGYTPAVYMYTSLAYSHYDLGELAGIELWVADIAAEPLFYYDFTIWQYSFTARIGGINTDVDLNLRFYRE